MRILLVTLLVACAAAPPRASYAVDPGGSVDLGDSAALLPSARCHDAGGFRTARELEDHARVISEIQVSSGRMSIASSPATRTIAARDRWWGFWDHAGGTFAVALDCAGAPCLVTATVVRRGSSACVERWLGTARRVR